MLTDEFADFANKYFGHFHYFGPFVVLLVCGVGLPIPEEVTLLACGYLVYENIVAFWPISLVCSAAILIGDSIPFWLGRIYGMRALQIGWVRRILHPERFAKLEERFRRHGNWATFAFRFFPGVRIPGYFVAGTLGMRYPRFLVLDALGVLISVPTSIWIGKLISAEIVNERVNKKFHIGLVLAVVALAIVLITRSRLRRSVGPPALDAVEEPKAEG